MKKTLLVVLIIALALRVFDLNLYPVGFTPDEASFGYDAYSMLKTGRDQWGRVLPLFLESFGDFKAPLYSYIAMPFVWILGLTKFAIRLPNAVIGVLAVYATYILSRELLHRGKWFIGSNKKSGSTVNHELLAVLSAFLLAVSPWHFMMSRGAFEANLTTFLMPLGAYLFLRGLEKPRLLNYSALVFGLNLFSYHSARFVTPFVILFLAALYIKELKNLGFTKICYPMFIFTVAIVLMGITFFAGSGRRAIDVSIASGALEAQAEERLKAINSGMNPIVAKIFHNKYLVTFDRFIFNYKKYASFNFIFKEGPGETTYGMIPGTPLMYVWEIPLISGFALLLFKNIKNRSVVFILLWIIVGFIPASLTTGVGRAANRAEVVLPALQIAASLGALSFYYLFKNVKYIRVLLFTLMLLIFTSAVFTYKNYRIDSLKSSGKGMLSGNLEMADFFSENYKEYNIVINRSLSEPHIYIAFSSKWDPADYQNKSKKWREYSDNGLTFLDQLGIYSLGRYTFTDFKYENYNTARNTLLVGRPKDFPSGTVPLKKFTHPSGEDALYIVNPGKETYAQVN